jgi:hypothetical protein
MDPKTRYRQRLKLQAALTRVMEVLAGIVAEEITPDRTTALMASQVLGKLLSFIKAAGLEPADLPVKSDLSRFLNLKRARLKETHKRKIRRSRK